MAVAREVEETVRALRDLGETRIASIEARYSHTSPFDILAPAISVGIHMGEGENGQRLPYESFEKKIGAFEMLRDRFVRSRIGESALIDRKASAILKKIGMMEARLLSSHGVAMPGAMSAALERLRIEMAVGDNGRAARPAGRSL